MCGYCYHITHKFRNWTQTNADKTPMRRKFIGIEGIRRGGVVRPAFHLGVRGTNLSSEVRTSEASRFPFIPESRKRFIASI